jgi:hypothetical protein
MISAMGLLLSASLPVFSALPDPVAFTINMELGDLRQAERWLDEGMSPDFMGSRIGTGLMIAAWEGKLDLMRLFVARGADVNKMNANGESAIALAAWRGNLEAVKWLLDNGARINAPRRKWSALHYAVFAGREEVADFLIAQGADINAQSTNGSTVLMMSVYEGHTALAKKLIEKGADRTPRNDWGDGALQWAMRHDRLEIARMVSNPEEFNIAVSQPKEKWGEPVRSMRTSKELEELLSMREKLVERSMSTTTIDKRIATERMRIVRAEMDRPKAARAASMEITASRKKPQEQSASIVYDDKGNKTGFKAPPATYFGTPKMPAKVPVKNY